MCHVHQPSLTCLSALRHSSDTAFYHPSSFPRRVLTPPLTPDNNPATCRRNWSSFVSLPARLGQSLDPCLRDSRHGECLLAEPHHFHINRHLRNTFYHLITMASRIVRLIARASSSLSPIFGPARCGEVRSRTTTCRASSLHSTPYGAAQNSRFKLEGGYDWHFWGL